MIPRTSRSWRTSRSSRRSIASLSTRGRIASTPPRSKSMGGRHRRCSCSRRSPIRRLVAALLVVLFAPVSARAYRPFVSTDAAVADVKEVEIELGYFNLERTRRENTITTPAVVLNYGVAKNWEVVGEFRLEGRCGIGSWGGRCLSLADYVTMMGSADRAPPARGESN